MSTGPGDEVGGADTDSGGIDQELAAAATSVPSTNGVVAEGAPGQVREEILRLRGSIDNIDAALMHLLAERFKCTQRVGELKAQGGLPPADPERDAEQIARLVSIGQAAGLDPLFAEQFRNFIVAEVKRRHALIAAHLGDSAPALDTYS